ncbi:unnamed protein product [Phytophthora fragariaefolia]|uniref:Unnamed protein product n=1 Tax=Phytophthora fragariaefolia TaxID=1490495 RepID=A0A9W6Y6S8_9STRA|nr:unnamed protein product [Phytophthora fragariaefolia]
MAAATEIAQRAAARDQDRRARYYKHRVRQDEDGNAAGIVRPDPQATATRSRPEQTAGERTASLPSLSEGTQMREGRRHARRVVRVREEAERQEQPVPRSSIDTVATAKQTDTAVALQHGGERTAVAVRPNENSADETRSGVSDQTRTSEARRLDGERPRKRRRKEDEAAQ